MIFYSVPDFAPTLSNAKGRLLGLDIGDKTLGLALSDESRHIATAFRTLKRVGAKRDIEALLLFVQEFHIQGFVAGWPLEMSGKAGAQCEKVKSFVDKLIASINCPVLLWDERLSTVAVTRTLIDAGLRRDRQKQVVDQTAASYILQGALDSIRLLQRS